MGRSYKDTMSEKSWNELKRKNKRKRGKEALKKATDKDKEAGTYKHPMKDDKNRWNVKDIVKAVHSGTGAYKPPKKDARKRSETDYEQFKRLHSSGKKAAYKWKEPSKEDK